MVALDDAELLVQRIQKLNAIGIALSNEHDDERLLEIILLGAKELTNADGGTLYSVTEQGTLRFRTMRTDSLDIALGGTTGAPINLPDVPLHRDDGAANHESVVAHAVLTRSTVVIADAYETDRFDFSGTRAFDARTGYRSTSMLTIPMRDHQDEIIGVLQLLNALDETGQIVPFSAGQVQLVESLASQASIITTNRRLIDEITELFEAFVKLIARAIDDKSPYTGNHCRRVPEITMRLAEAAHAQADGPLADFHMNDADRYELLIASWLHDCGKITTPEWVMDKATKLQTIHDRISEVATRFACLRRDAEYRCLQRIIQGADADAERQALAAELAELSEELAFLRRCNVGGERMEAADQDRVHTIAQRVWIDSAGHEQQLLSEEEVRNLCIPKGTLLDEERQVINHHIVATIHMLEQLPFPKHLADVPEIACGHHERMDGKGYPRGLTREQMSVKARCMGIADVFEALTADDRPYKKAMPLSQALTILGRMKLDGHIDPDLFDVFLWEGVYLDFAKAFLNPAQIDDIDLESIPGYVPRSLSPDR
jgi:HD-GYP domain-containing protein (c-di-GMP phosphodiesterase class II)